MVVTIHDLYSVCQSTGFATEDFRKMKARRYMDLAKRADRIVVVSESCRQGVLEALPVDPNLIKVIHLAGGDEFHPRPPGEVLGIKQRYGLSNPYFLYVGSLNKRKNLPAMIRAFSMARQKAHSQAQFAIAGRLGFGSEETLQAIGQAGPEGIKLLGYVPDPDLPALMSGAEALLFVTCYEGFGIPVLEAFGCGCPVIGGNQGSVPEIAASAALLTHPSDEEGIAQAILEILTDPKTKISLREKGLNRAKGFTWEKTARATLEVYKEILI